MSIEHTYAHWILSGAHNFRHALMQKFRMHAKDSCICTHDHPQHMLGMCTPHVQNPHSTTHATAHPTAHATAHSTAHAMPQCAHSCQEDSCQAAASTSRTYCTRSYCASGSWPVPACRNSSGSTRLRHQHRYLWQNPRFVPHQHSRCLCQPNLPRPSPPLMHQHLVPPPLHLLATEATLRNHLAKETPTQVRSL